jgi:hypothetical protein
MVRILWGVFVGSLGTVIWLLASADPGASRGMATPEALRDAPAAERPARDGPPAAKPLERAAAPLPSVVSAGDPEGSSSGLRAEPDAIAEPQEFLERLIEMAWAGDLEALGARIGPGVARASGGLLEAILKKRLAGEDGTSEDGEGSSEVDEMLDQLEIELEPLADGTVRVHASGPGGAAPEERDPQARAQARGLDLRGSVLHLEPRAHGGVPPGPRDPRRAAGVPPRAHDVPLEVAVGLPARRGIPRMVVLAHESDTVVHRRTT